MLKESTRKEARLMAKSSITAITVQDLESPRTLRRDRPDQVLRLDTAGGSIFLKKSTVDRAGDSWPRVTARLKSLAQQKHIPFQDQTK
jgi:hypothetical protein